MFVIYIIASRYDSKNAAPDTSTQREMAYIFREFEI